MDARVKSAAMLLCVLLFFTSVARAQEEHPAPISSITMALVMPQAIDGLTDASISQLENKITALLTDNGFASTDNDHTFVINPKFDITSVQETSATLQKLFVANCNLYLFIKQTGTGVILASVTKQIQGTGYTKEEAIASAVTQIAPDDAKLVKFIEQGKAKIIVYYQQNCQLFINNADRELAQHHYDASRKILLGIPQETGQCYTDAQQKILEIFNQQYGSPQKAEVAFQKQVTIDPSDEAAKRNLEIVQKAIEVHSDQDKTPPVIELITPKTTRGQGVEADVTKDNSIYVSGTAKDPSGISTVVVNGKTIGNLNPDGFFQTNISKDFSDITVSATDKKGNSASVTLHIISKNEAKTTADDIIQPISDGEKFHAIFIANSDYGGGKWPALNTTVGEARSIIRLLVDKYNFEAANIDTLFNKSRKDILTAVSNKVQSLNSNDNLIIFYGGHGYFVESTNMAYWVPINADNEFDYISNTQITNLITDCKAHHILIMADACFSGAMRGGLEAPAKYEFKFKSRQLLTSGGTEPVPGKSAYVQMILKALNDNEDKYLSARDLYVRIAKGIMDQTNTEPTIRDLIVAGNEGGQFYFKKN